jgi:integrase
MSWQRSHRLGAVFEVMALTGLRRGEALGLRWDDVDLSRAMLTVRQQLVQVGRQREYGPPKTASGEHRVVELDDVAVGALIGLRLRQDQERLEWGEAYNDLDLVFAREDGSAILPDTVSKTFRRLAVEAGLRPIRLHDLRHGQASLMLAAGVPMPIVSKRLGHSTLTITSDTYLHLLEGVGRDAAQRAANLVPRQPRDTHVTPTAQPGSAEPPEPRRESRDLLVRPVGLEPTTYGLKVRSSNRLS